MNMTCCLENDAKLFTPGPLTTSLTVKQAMLHDLGSRDTVFMNIVAHIREKLLKIAGCLLGNRDSLEHPLSVS